MGRASRVQKLALLTAMAFFLVCALRFWLLYGGQALYRVSATKQETDISQEKQEEWPVSLLPGERIDLNTAPAADLARLPQIGAKRAEAIVAWREEYGPFQSAGQLVEVSGIGVGILEEISGYITVSGTD